MTVIFLNRGKVEQLQNAINGDEEFKLASRFMSEDILLEVDELRCLIRVQDGVVTEITPDPGPVDRWSFSIKANVTSWEKLLQPSPPPFFTGLNAGMIRGNLEFTGNLEVAFACFWAMNRMLDIMREQQNK